MDSNQDFGSILNNFSGSSPKGQRQDSGEGVGSLLNTYDAARARPTRSTPIDGDGIKGLAAQEGAEHLLPVIGALYGQESGSGATQRTSIDGARGGMQVMPATFQRYAKPGERIDNPEDNMRVGIRIVKDLATKFGDDPAKIATGYFSGEGNVNAGQGSAWREDRADGNGKRVSSYVADVLKRVGAVVPSAEAATLPDLGKAPKWADVEAKPEFKALPADKQAEAKAAYFDYWIAPHAGQREAELRQKFLAKQEPGFVDKALGVAKDIGSAVVDAVTPAKSVMEGKTIPAAPDLPTTSKVPVKPEVRAAFNAQWDAATPEQRNEMAQREDWVGMLAKERAGVFEQQDATGLKSMQAVDPRIEARVRALVAKGENPEFAERAVREAAAAGVAPGREVEFITKKYGTINKSEFDFDTKALFDQQGGTNGLNNPLSRGVAKGALGIGKAVTGYGEFLADAMGLDHASKTMREGGNWARGKEQAIGESGNFMERNFEGAINSIAQQLPLLITGTKLESEAVPLAGMAMQSFGQEYSDGRAAGQSVGEATTRASIFAAFEVIGEKFGLKENMQAIKAAAHGLPSDQIVGFLWSALKKEVPGEVLTTTGQFATDKLPGGVGLNPNATGADYLKQVADTVAQTIMQSGVMAGGTTGVSKAVQYARDRGPLQGVAEADAELARQQALNKWNTNGLNNRIEPKLNGTPDVANVTPDGRIEPTIGGDQTVTPAEPAGAPAVHPTTQAADDIVRELANDAGIPHETVLPAAKVETTGPAPISDQDVQEFAANRFQQLRQKRDGQIQSVAGEGGVVDQDMPGVGLSAAEQQEMDTLQRAGGDTQALRQLYGFDQSIPSDQSQLANQAQVPAPATGPVEQPVNGELFPAATEPGLVAAQENQSETRDQQGQATGPALDQGAVVATGQPSGPATEQEPAAQAAAAQNDVGNAVGNPGQQDGTVQASGALTEPQPAPAARQGQFSSADEAKQYISQQRRASSTTLPRALPLPYADGSFGIVTEGGDGWADAQAFAKANAPKTEKQAKERRNGTQATQAEQAKAQGQEAPAAAQSAVNEPKQNAGTAEGKAPADQAQAAAGTHADADAQAAGVSDAGTQPAVEAAGVEQPTTGYSLPDKISADWGAEESPTFKPTPRQQVVMGAVSQALDEGLFYNSDLDKRVAELLNVTPEIRQRNKSNVQGGDFGFDVYYARKAVEAQRRHASDKAIREAMNLKAGDKLGTLIFNDFKVNTNVVVESVSDDGNSVAIKGKRGSYTVTATASPTNIKGAIERAKERGKRKDGYDEFLANRAKPQTEKQAKAKRGNVSQKTAENDTSEKRVDASDKPQRYEYPTPLKGQPAYIEPAQRAVVDFMNGDIDKAALLQRFADLDLTEAQIRSVTNRIDITKDEIDSVATLRAAKQPPAKPKTEKEAKAKRAAPKVEKSATPATESSANTEDAGAELTYNKRNRIKTGIQWSDIADKDAALRVKETTKQNVYPRPDYQALVDGGMQPLVAHIVKQAYDSLATTPQISGKAPTDEQLKAYIDGMRRYMDGVMSWANDPDHVKAWLGKIAQRAAVYRAAYGGARTSLTELAGTATDAKSLLETVYPNGWKENRAELILIGGNKALSGLQPSTDEAVKAMKDIEKGWPGKQEAWQKQGYKIVSGEKLEPDFYESTRSEKPRVYAMLKFNDGRRNITIVERTFEGIQSKDDPQVQEWVKTEQEAYKPRFVVLDKLNRVKAWGLSQAEAEQQARDLTKRSGGGSTVKDEGISVEMAERTGVEHRMPGEDISSERLIETFGFRGVNFGNWMKGDSNKAERQLHLNHIYDAFMDLAAILNVPPKALSLDGMLGVAVGAQGNGRASAHFVPGVNEINLTRTAGAGALAHEWGHALDHYFARQADLTRESTPYLTEHSSLGATMKRTELVDGKYQTVDKPRFGEGVRPEIVEAFKSIVQAMKKREMTPEELAQSREASLARAKKNTDGWLKAVRRDFEHAKASEEVLAKFDALAERVRNLDLGDGKVQVSAHTFISQPVSDMRDLYKQVTKRTYSLDQTKGLQSNIDHLKYVSEEKQDAETHKPQSVSTTYANEAAKIDKDKGGKPYWSTTIEMFARAFDAYVFDKVAASEATNTYLAGLNNSIETSPMGEERKAINAAFDKLVGTLKHEETEAGGVRLFDFTRSPSLAFLGQPKPVRVNALQKLEKLEAKRQAGKITEAEFQLGVQQVIAAMRNQKEERDYRDATTGRRRGYDWVVAQLNRYVADQQIDREVSDFAEWMLDQNPNLANDLGIGITTKDNVAGDYNPASSVFRLVAGKANPGTAVHEILHHTERMMPGQVQDGVLSEWQRAFLNAIKAATKAGDKKLQQALLDMAKASVGSKDAYDRVQQAFNDGTLVYDQHYQLYSPSEFWAVNATRIMSGRYAAKGSWVKRAVQWFKEFVQRVKGVFGLPSDAPILKALKSVMNGDGQFQQDARMLVDRADEKTSHQGERTFNDFTRKAQNNAIQFFGNRDGQSLKTFGAYEKTLSTQYNKALKDKHFGKVFGYVNAMQNEVSLTSIRPAELAPGVLPRLDDVKSALATMVKGKPESGPLNHAAKAIFDGTLAGDSVLQGKVWTQAQFMARPGATEASWALYQQARAAIDASLDEVAAAEAYAMAQGFVPKAMRRQIIDNPGQAQGLIANDLKKQMRMLEVAIEKAKKLGAEEQQAELESALKSYQSTLDNIDKIFVTSKNLKVAGYAPLMRFGKFTVSVQQINPATGQVLRDENGESQTLFYKQYETEGEAKAVRRQMQAKYADRDDVRVSAGTKSQTAHELYNGITPETLALFAEAIGADNAMRKYIELAMTERSALKRRLHRKGTEGYSDDLPRVLANFITSNGRHAAQRYYLRDLNNAIKYIPKEKGDVLDEANRLKKFVMNPNDPGAPLSSAMFAWFLGGSVASAVVNLTQPVMMTAPYLTQFGVTTAGKAMATAMPYALGRKQITDASLRDALKRASQEGIVDAQEIFHLYSVGAQGVAANLASALAKVPGVGGKIKAGSEDARARINAFLTLWGSMFAVAEGFNRKLTFIAAWEVAKANGEKNPYAFAVRAVNETQGIYNKVNRPNWGQGPVGRTLLTFKQYSIMYVELLTRMWKRGGPEGKRAALIMLAVLMLASGEEGLPFSQDLDDLIDTVGQFMGFDTNMRRNKRRLAHEVLGKTLGDLFLYGVSSYLPLDFAGRVGLGNLIPGTGVLKPSNEQGRAREVAEIFGPTAGMATQVADAYDAVVEGNTGKAVQNLAPKAVKDALAGGEMAKKGYATDSRGRKVIDVTKGEAAIKGIGFNPTSVAQETRKTMPVQQDIALQKRTESSIVNLWVRGLADGDTEMVKDAQQRLNDWNRRNPDTLIRINPDQIRSLARQMATEKDTRLLKSAPREMRGRIGLDLAK